MHVEYLNHGITLKMVRIPEGAFLMGAPDCETSLYHDESPLHEVKVPTFAMGQFLVTQAQYECVMGNNPSYFKGADKPVECVSWYNAVEFCKKLSNQTGRAYRLPTEAEWEYACRAWNTTRYSFGDVLKKSQANFNSDSTTDVGSFAPNDFGLYDMHGNVWEWCQDTWHGSYYLAPDDGSAWVTGRDTNKIVRGGSWFFNHWSCRSASRKYYFPDGPSDEVGFRVACNVMQQTSYYLAPVG